MSLSKNVSKNVGFNSIFHEILNSNHKILDNEKKPEISNYMEKSKNECMIIPYLLDACIDFMVIKVRKIFCEVMTQNSLFFLISDAAI